MNEKQQRKMMNIMEALDSGAVQPDELKEVVDFILELMVSVKEQLDEKMTENRDEMTDKMKTYYNEISVIDSKMRVMKDEIAKNTAGDINVVKEQIKKVVKDLEDLRGSMPEEIDLSDVWRKLTEIETKIPKIPDEITGEQIVDKINDLSTDDDNNKIDIAHIKGWKKFEKDINDLKNRPSGGGIVGRDFIQDIDISSQLNGVLKTFNIPAVWRVITVDLDSYPYGSLRKTIDYTWTTKTITFTSNIDAATQLATGQKCILTVVRG